MKRLKFTDQEIDSALATIRQKLSQNLKAKGMQNISLDFLRKDLERIPDNIKYPTIFIEPTAYIQMLELVRQSPIEISWHGLVHRDITTNTYLIYDILVFPQLNSATTTTADEKGFAEWQTNLISDMEFPIEDLRMHGHSHVNMNVFSSGVDDQYQEDILHKVEDGDYYLFLIMNKKSDICALLYDFNQNILFETEDIYMEIIGKDSIPIAGWTADQIKKNCKEERIIPKKQNPSQFKWDEKYGGYYLDKEDWDAPIVGKSKKKVSGGYKNGSK